MMTRKDYAISLGLAKPGRGRLSKEAHAAIAQAEANGMTFADGSSKSAPVEPVLIKSEKQRDTEEFYGYTAEGWKVGFARCGACHQHIKWCNCPNGVLAPSIVVTLDNSCFDQVVLRERNKEWA